MSKFTRSERKRTQTQFLGGTEVSGRAGRDQPAERRARAAAIASAYEPLGGLVQLGAVGGGEGRVWVGADAVDADVAAAHHQDKREARNCFDAGGVRMLFSVTDAAARPMVFSRRQPPAQPGSPAQLQELLRSHADLVIMDKEAAGSGGCSSTFHGRLGAGVTISIDAVPTVFIAGLLSQHPICSTLFSTGSGMQGSSSRVTAAAAAARSAKAVLKVYERFESACDDLDSGLFDLADRHCYCCMQFFAGAGGSKGLLKDGHQWCLACSYQVHGLGTRGGQHKVFGTTERPNNRCSGCAGCSPIRR
jgi:hypothetical protein